MADEAGSLLVVDDDEMNRDMFSRRLQHKGYAVTVARDGRQALKLLGDRRFDLVLLDVMMPGVNGLEVLKTIRTIDGPTDLPVIMTTARGESRDVVEALNLGANDYVTKPLDFPVVLARIQTQLALKRAADQVQGLQQSLASRTQEWEAARAGLRAAAQRLQDDRDAAARALGALLPTRPPDVPGARFAWVHRPCEELAGDLFNVRPLDDRHLAVYLLEVGGRGVPAALRSLAVGHALAHAALAGPGAGALSPPDRVAAELNRLFPADPAAGQHCTLVYGHLDPAGGEFRFVSAGHPGPVHLAAGKPAAVLRARGLPVGLGAGDGGYKEAVVRLGPGDRLLLYSDGLTDAPGPDGERFGTERLLRACEQHRGLPLDGWLTALATAVEEWSAAGAAPDDRSALAVEVAAPQG
jgi:sigma-B regulation protein RsbU (phosphoserine phosphatase)